MKQPSGKKLRTGFAVNSTSTIQMSYGRLSEALDNDPRMIRGRELLARERF